MDEAPVVVATFGKPELAGMAASVLRAEGLNARVNNRLLAEVDDWALGPGGVEVHVLVPAAEEEKARRILAETVTPEPRPNPGGVLVDGLACLSCGGAIADNENACPACGWTWELPEGDPAAPA